MMRQAVGVGVERGVAQRAVLEHHRDRVRRARRLRRKQRRQASPPRRRSAPVRAVSFQPRRMVSRSAVVQDRQRRPARGPASATTASSSRISRSPSAATLASSNRSLAYSSTPSMPAGAPSAARRSTSPSDRSNFALAGRDRLRPHRKPRQLQRAAARRRRLERQHHLEQRMPRQRPRRIEHLHQPLERQIRMAHRPQGCCPAPARSARVKLGLPEVSVRSTSVLTKNPISSSSAASVRPAIGLPIAMSVPAPSRLSSPASPACSTMNRLAPAVPRQRRKRPVQLGADRRAPPARRGGSTPPAAAGRPAARSAPAGPSALASRTQAAARSRSRRRPRRPAPPAATACSRRTAPAAAAAPPPPPRSRAR